MHYLYQAIRAALIDWFLDRWLDVQSWAESKRQALKANALQKLRAPNTEGR